MPNFEVQFVSLAACHIDLEVKTAKFSFLGESTRAISFKHSNYTTAMNIFTGLPKIIPSVFQINLPTHIVIAHG